MKRNTTITTFGAEVASLLILALADCSTGDRQDRVGNRTEDVPL